MAVIRRETRNVLWAALEAAVSGGLSLVSAFVIARMIGPEAFGIATAAIALHVMLWVVANALFADALVQRPTLDEATAASAFWAGLATGCACALVQAGGGFVLAALFHAPRLLRMCVLLALPLPLVGIGGVAQGLLTRRRAYRLLAGRAILGQGLGTAAGIAIALRHGGPWSPIGQQFVASATGAIILLAGARLRPRALWQPSAVRALLRIAVPLTASTLVLTARYRLFAVLVGGTAGASALGEMHMAFRLVDTVRELCNTAQWRLMLPTLAERQSDPAALRAKVDRLTRQSNMLVLPLCGAMALTLPILTVHVLSPAWAGTGRAAEPLVALMAALSLTFPAGVAVIARGQTGRPLLGNLACLALTLGGVLWLRPASPMQAVLIWCGGQMLVAPYILWINGRAIEAGPLRPLRGGMPVLLTVAAALALALAVPAHGTPAGTTLRLGVFAAALLAGSLPLLAGNRLKLAGVFRWLAAACR